MPSHIVKPERDKYDDFYIVWSSVVDNLTAAGTRAEFLAEHSDWGDRLDRADEYGSSAIWADPAPYGWEDDDLLVCNDDAADAFQDGYAVVPRKNLRAYAERRMVGADTTDLLVFKEWE